MNSLRYEDFEAGRVYAHDIRRTITEGDNVLLSCMTLNLQPLHIDAEFAGRSIWGKVLVDSMVTIGVIMGIHSLELTYCTSPGGMRIKDVRFPNPVFHGDTLNARTTVLGKSDEEGSPGCGRVEFLLEGFTQRGDVIMSCTWSKLVVRRS
ncbi:MAG: MaoC family dehydratase [Alphaproteobacteria bacterium]